MAGAEVKIAGNITADPELKFTNNGHARLAMGVAVNKRVLNKETNQWEDGDTSFFNVVFWRDLAEHAAEILEKGSAVMVTGRLESRTWETPEGDKKTIVEVVADKVGLDLWGVAEYKRRRKGGGDGQAAKQAPKAAPTSNPFEDAF